MCSGTNRSTFVGKATLVPSVGVSLNPRSAPIYVYSPILFPPRDICSDKLSSLSVWLLCGSFNSSWVIGVPELFLNSVSFSESSFISFSLSFDGVLWVFPR